LLIGTAIAVVVADQASKALALSALAEGRRIPLVGRYLDLRLVRNPGSAFGLFQSSTIAVFAASLVILSVVSFWAFQNPSATVRFGLVVGGGAGNLIDRIFRPPGFGKGHVIDFINLSFWPTFNLADSAIVTGVTLLLAESVWRKP
jgi:signal peptidase II